MSVLPPDFDARLSAYTAAASQQPPARRAAVAAVLRDGEHGKEVLLMQRSEHPADPWSGQVSLPGGNRDPGDGHLLFTAQRETREEVGLELASELLVCQLDPVLAVARRLEFEMDITPFVFRAPPTAEPRPGPEAREVFWLPLEAAAAGVLDAEHRYQDGDLVRLLPAWQYQDRVVWGLTYRMLRSLLSVGGVPG